jgi:hypothetical protein
MGPEDLMPPAPFSLALYLIVRVYDTTDLTAATLMESRQATEDVLRAPNVQVVWRTCPAGRASTTGHDAGPGHAVTDQADCERPLDSQELVMRITTARPETAPDWLGYSYVDTARRTGTLATVFADRIRSAAGRLGMETGTLMGRAMAHELIHLILGTTAHARTGLMRPDWMAPPQPNDWLLSRIEAERVQRGLIARTVTVAPPPVVATGQSECLTVACAAKSELLSTRP